MWREELVQRLEGLEHPAWGPEHCRRMYQMADMIADAESLDIDDDVLFAAAWLHDVGTFAEYRDDCDPPECAARAAERILPEIGFPADKLELVARIIREHSFTGESRDTPEARVLRDADMLEFLGAVGVTRLLSIVELEEWVPDPKAAIELASDFARELPGKVLYESSRRVAEHRAMETSTFVMELADETSSLDEL